MIKVFLMAVFVVLESEDSMALTHPLDRSLLPRRHIPCLVEEASSELFLEHLAPSLFS